LDLRPAGTQPEEERSEEECDDHEDPECRDQDGRREHGCSRGGAPYARWRCGARLPSGTLRRHDVCSSLKSLPAEGTCMGASNIDLPSKGRQAPGKAGGGFPRSLFGSRQVDSSNVIVILAKSEGKPCPERCRRRRGRAWIATGLLFVTAVTFGSCIAAPGHGRRSAGNLAQGLLLVRRCRQSPGEPGAPDWVAGPICQAPIRECAAWRFPNSG
jgi:hypothetical protein